jgi:hypothetical protein
MARNDTTQHDTTEYDTAYFHEWQSMIDRYAPGSFARLTVSQ